jgi:imidazolonepropionase
VDAHTHVVYAGDRRHELRRRLDGESYAAIAAGGGGILSTVAATRRASDDELIASAVPRLDEMLRCGTTTAEAKSGYALTVDGELRLLRVIRRLSVLQPIELVATFLGAHEVPGEHRGDPEGYVRLVVDEMIPAVARSGLAESCDVFCEAGAFTASQSTAVLEAGRAAGMVSRIHADELSASGGAEVAASIGARSADHLVFTTRNGAAALAVAGTVATLLPAAAFYLKLGRFAPARLFIDQHVPVALGTDLNPGAGLTCSMPFVVALGCFEMGLTLEESIVGATINSAYALNRHERVGSLEVGKQMDAVILKGPLEDLLRVGVSAVRSVIKRGKLVYDAGSR